MADLNGMMKSTSLRLVDDWRELPTKLKWAVCLCSFLFVIQVAFIASHLSQLVSHIILTAFYFITVSAVTAHRRSRLDRLLNAIDKTNIIVKFTPEGEIKAANSLFCASVGYEPEELIGKHHRVLVPERTKTNSRYKYFWRALKEGKPWSGTYERVTKDGDSIWVLGNYTPVLVDGKVHEIVKVARNVTDQVELQIELQTKNTYLEHAAKILRHDMHSGINTYIPRGVTSLERRLEGCVCKKRSNLEVPLRLIKEGLTHTQKVYAGVKEFTNLVKPDSALEKQPHNLRDLLKEYLASTAYRKQVVLEDLPIVEVNGPLFCTAVDNLIRNGLKYNDSPTKLVIVRAVDGGIAVIDNGRGMTQREFHKYSKPYVRKEGQVESGSGLGLNICIAILREHGFSVTCDKLATGTLIRIETNDQQLTTGR